MFSLQKFLGKDERFYDLLEASAQSARNSVQALKALLQSPEQGRTLDEFIQARRKDKKITEQITEELCKTFVTPMEREDIEALSHALYRIPKTVEKFGERLVLCPGPLPGEYFQKQTAMLEQAVETVWQMVHELRQRAHLEQAKDRNDRLQYLEGEADKLMLDLYRDLYSGKLDAVKVVVLKDLYELLEKVIDRCRDAGNIIFQIVLKYS